MTDETNDPIPADAAPGEGAAEASPAIPAESPTDALQRECEELRDRWLRATAEFDNYRKRTERDRREQADRAVVDVLQEFLLVVDDFDRAMDAAPSDDMTAYRQGVGLIHAKLHDTLRKLGVTPIDALGADFNPEVHQAVVQEPADGHRDQEVTAELRKGYRLRDRLLRPSMVKVAKA